MSKNKKLHFLIVFVLLSTLSPTHSADEDDALFEDFIEEVETAPAKDRRGDDFKTESMTDAPPATSKSMEETELSELELNENLEVEKDNLDTKELTETVVNDSNFEEVNDLEELKTDIGDIIFEGDNSKTSKNEKMADKDAVEIFNISAEEQKLVELAKFVEGRIPDEEWDEVATAAKVESYVVQSGDWLWKISQRLFGSGFYYSKVWSLNPQITNPHNIEPGMTLVFTTGDENKMPEVKLGEFPEGDLAKVKKQLKLAESDINIANNVPGGKPSWLEERKKLIKDGVYFQYASSDTISDLQQAATEEGNTEYKKYEPPVTEINISEPLNSYDEQGFDKNSRITFDVKEGFYLNTFVATNVVQDFGEIYGSPGEHVFLQRFESIFVDFDKSVGVKPGDKFSIYSPGGVVSHTSSDRQGYKYTVTAQIQAEKAFKGNKWRCKLIEISGLVQRGDRVTVYTPKIGRIIKTFNKRNIEAAIVGAFQDSAGGLSMGDVTYIDRGRADGVEIGTIFELYSFVDNNTEKRLTTDPSYKIGEGVVISLTDNFSTMLLINSTMPINLGTLAITKSEENAALARMNKKLSKEKVTSKLTEKAVNELDIELNLDDLSTDLLEKAEKVKLTADEVEELDRLEREKSVIQDHEKDLRELEQLEADIVDAEGAIKESKLDEDKFLEQEDLNAVEQKTLGSADGLESLDDLEEEFGIKYMDENLNSKENPYGLTEFDLEEIDELLNTEKL